MHHRDDRPLAATAIVTAVLFGVGALVQVINSANEPNIVAQRVATSTPLWVMAGK